jgi:hypothetical protein
MKGTDDLSSASALLFCSRPVSTLLTNSGRSLSRSSSPRSTTSSSTAPTKASPREISTETQLL